MFIMIKYKGLYHIDVLEARQAKDLYMYAYTQKILSTTLVDLYKNHMKNRDPSTIV